MGVVIYKHKKDFFRLQNLFDEFAYEVNRKLDWFHCGAAIGGLIQSKIAECLVCEHKGVPIAMLIYSYFPNLFSGELESTELVFYVSKRYRGLKCAVHLLDEAEKRQKEKGCKKINMVSLKMDDNASKIYMKRGFSFSELCMSKDI